MRGRNLRGWRTGITDETPVREGAGVCNGDNLIRAKGIGIKISGGWVENRMRRLVMFRRNLLIMRLGWRPEGEGVRRVMIGMVD